MLPTIYMRDGIGLDGLGLVKSPLMAGNGIGNGIGNEVVLECLWLDDRMVEIPSSLLPQIQTPQLHLLPVSVPNPSFFHLRSTPFSLLDFGMQGNLARVNAWFFPEIHGFMIHGFLDAIQNKHLMTKWIMHDLMHEGSFFFSFISAYLWIRRVPDRQTEIERVSFASLKWFDFGSSDLFSTCM